MSVGVRRIRDVPDLVAVVVALDGVVAGEREVGVGAADELAPTAASSRRRCRFHAASPASIRPALRPTRGSGLGGASTCCSPRRVGRRATAVDATAHAPAQEPSRRERASRDMCFNDCVILGMHSDTGRHGLERGVTAIVRW